MGSVLNRSPRRREEGRPYFARESAAPERAQYLQLLNEAGIAAAPAPLSPEAVLIEKPVDVSLLPGFDKGWVSVQDVSAQLVAGLLAANQGSECSMPVPRLAARRVIFLSSNLHLQS